MYYVSATYQHKLQSQTTIWDILRHTMDYN